MLTARETRAAKCHLCSCLPWHRVRSCGLPSCRRLVCEVCLDEHLKSSIHLNEVTPDAPTGPVVLSNGGRENRVLHQRGGTHGRVRSARDGALSVRHLLRGAGSARHSQPLEELGRTPVTLVSGDRGSVHAVELSEAEHPRGKGAPELTEVPSEAGHVALLRARCCSRPRTARRYWWRSACACAGVGMHGSTSAFPT